MTGQEKHTRLTLDEMIRRSEQVRKQRTKIKQRNCTLKALTVQSQ